MRRKPQSYSMQALHAEVLRPLVDLAYTSTFSEVRRDTAAAFATLSFNGKRALMLIQQLVEHIQTRPLS
jgi:hypothetical protein